MNDLANRTRATPGKGNSAATIRRIVDYYDQTLSEYRLVLGLDWHLGIHYGYYDDRHRTYRAASRNMNRMLAEMTELTPGMRVLDAGCGVGGSSIWLAENLATHVTGITITPSQCVRARRLARDRGLQHLTHFLVRDYCDTGFDADSFDAVWALESVCYADEKRAFVREARRILRPGGRLIVADGFRTTRNLAETDELLMQRWLSGWAVDDLDTLDEFAATLDAEDFQHCQIDDITPNVMPFATMLRRRVTALMPAALVLLWLGLWDPIKVDNGRAALYQYAALRRGLWRYVIFAARKQNADR